MWVSLHTNEPQVDLTADPFFLQHLRPPRRCVHSTLDPPGHIQQAFRRRFLRPVRCSRVNHANPSRGVLWS